ncbi:MULTISPECIES: hypothetical protein [Burkholderia cepacia complex]|uniref:hypothetical protein n=1 Tax=Burkholderia cepacia complex TaxID=87882 RepID=UPI000CFE6FEB|nr:MULTISPECIES: hypothetical protein [Burkholderia cepacia complex]MBR8042091.1 hypothetical protein [Burkholderia cenocepacia]PRG27006.1 hypothetical protein C6T62_27020 [Burkholderia multivorans]
MATILTQAVQDAILSSIAVDRIEVFDEFDPNPEVYSTNLYVDVTIDGATHTVVYQRGTDGTVEEAPWESWGMADVYIAILKVTGDFNGQDALDVKDMFAGFPDEWEASPAAKALGAEIVRECAAVAREAQYVYDAQHIA